MLSTPGHLGIALLAFAPVAYRLRRASRPGQFVVAGAAILVAGQWTNGDVLLRFAEFATLAPVILLATLLGVALLGWPRARHGSVPICALEAGVLGTAAHLLGDVVAEAGLSVTYPRLSVTYPRQLGGSGGGEYDVAMVTATPGDVSLTLLVLGTAAVVFALGHARIHGPIRTPPEPGEGVEPRHSAVEPTTNASKGRS